MKRKIFKVTARKLIDDSADSSYLGKYTDDYDPNHICRREGQFIADLSAPVKDCEECKSLSEENDEPTQCRKHEYNPPCKSREYRFFIPGNHWPHNPENWNHITGDALAKVIAEHGSIENADKAYALQDYRRSEALNKGQWCYIGIKVEAEVGISEDGKEWKTEKLSSTGLWGIKSDSGEEYFKSVIEEESNELRKELEAFGFSARIIREAFKRMEEENG